MREKYIFVEGDVSWSETPGRIHYTLLQATAPSNAQVIRIGDNRCIQYAQIVRGDNIEEFKKLVLPGPQTKGISLCDQHDQLGTVDDLYSRRGSYPRCVITPQGKVYLNEHIFRPENSAYRLHRAHHIMGDALDFFAKRIDAEGLNQRSLMRGIAP